MNVIEGRSIDRTIILGSGESILNLSTEEITHINKCKIVIAVNKYMAFYKQIGIIPTHVHFHDITGYNIFMYILKMCIKDNLEDLSIITCPYFESLTYKKRYEVVFRFLRDIFLIRPYPFAVIAYRFGNTTERYFLKAFRKFEYIKIPDYIRLISIDITKFKDEPKWATSLDERIYHFKGSVSSVLNVASILAPGQDIYLIGNDFNSKKYFYQNELDKLGIPWKDDTTNTTMNTGVHYSFRKDQQSSIKNAFPTIIKYLKMNNCQLFCNNKDSLLITEAGVPYKTLL